MDVQFKRLFKLRNNKKLASSSGLLAAIFSTSVEFTWMTARFRLSALSVTPSAEEVCERLYFTSPLGSGI
jgi:hypothetical protein